MTQEREEWGARLSGRFGRRTALRGGALAGAALAAAALIGCGDDDEDEPTAQPTGTTGTGTPQTSQPAHPDGDYVARAEADGAPYPYNYAEPDTEPKPGGTMRLAVAWDAVIFDTNKSASADAPSVANWVANRLVGYVVGPQMSKFKIELEPELAKSWEVSPDALTYTFHIQEGVKYHNVAPLNGRAFLAKDVVEHYERARAEGVNRAQFDAVDTITAPNEQTVIIKMKVPDVDFLFPLANKSLPIYPTELYEQNLINTKPIGTGPFIFDEAVKGQYIRGSQNPDYWEGKPFLDGFEYRVMPDVAARTAAFRADQVDFPSLATAKKDREPVLSSKPNVAIMSDPVLVGGLAGVYGLNTSTKFADERIRQALMLSIDRPKLVELLAQGEGVVLPGFGWPFIFDQMPSGDELGPWFRYDPTEAKSLLAAAGAENLEFEVVSTSGLVGASSSDPINSAFAGFYREIGVDMKVRNTDTAAFQSMYYAKQWLATGADSQQGWSTPAAPTANGYFYTNVYSQSPTNYFGVNDPDVDDWASKQRGEVNPETRKELQRRIWDRVLEKAYRIESVSTFSVNIWQPWVRYWRFNGPYIGIHQFYDWGMNSHLAWLDK